MAVDRFRSRAAGGGGNKRCFGMWKQIMKSKTYILENDENYKCLLFTWGKNQNICG